MFDDILEKKSLVFVKNLRFSIFLFYKNGQENLFDDNLNTKKPVWIRKTSILKS